MVQFETKLSGFVQTGCKDEKERCDFKDETKLNFLICSSALKKQKQKRGFPWNICIPCQSNYFIIYNRLHDTLVELKPVKYHRSRGRILCQLSKWSPRLHCMVQIPEINANDEESASLRILRSSGLKFPVSADAGNQWVTVRVGPLSGVPSPS